MADLHHPATDSADQPQLAQPTPRKLEKLRTRGDFVRLTRSSRKCATRGLVLQVAQQPDDLPTNTPRVGFTASKKVGNAVARNRVKRRLRALAQTVLADQAQPSLDYVLVGRHTTLTRPWSKLVDDLGTALARTQLDDTDS